MKNIDHTPDITSDEYWDNHHIAVVRVAEVVPDEPNRPAVRYRVERKISEGEIKAEHTTPLRHWWFGAAREGAPSRGAPGVAPGGAYVVFYRREGKTPVVAIPLDTSPEHSALVQRLERIARLRGGEGGVPALAAAVFDPDRVVALYALKHLRKERTRAVDPPFLDRLRALRDDEQADPELRMAAASLFGGTRAAGGDSQYAWLQEALSSARGHDWAQLRAFALQMLEFPEERARTAELLTGIVRDAARPQELRIAAYSVFEDERLFRGDPHDPVSERIFETVEWMQQSPDAFLRAAAAMLLHNLAVRYPPEEAPRYAARARAALRSALAAAPDPGTGHVIQRSLELLQPPGEPA